MYRLITLFIAACFALLSGCASPTRVKNVEVYTFKKERVDQKIYGNQGYLMGTPPEVGPRDTKRTLIGVDIELPSFGGDDAAPVSGTDATGSSSSGSAVTIVGEEEEWIK